MNFHHELTPTHFNQIGTEGLHGLLGMEIIEVRERMILAELPVTGKLFAGNGYVHAGSIVGFADTTSGYGCLAHLPQSAISFTTIELKSNFLTSAKIGVLVCRSEPVHLGRTTQVWDATVSHKETNKTMAIFRCTQLIIY